MKMRVVVEPDGKVSLFAEEGTFSDAKKQIEFLMAALEIGGVPFAEKGEVEQHRHDHEGEAIHAHSHHHAGSHTHEVGTHTEK